MISIIRKNRAAVLAVLMLSIACGPLMAQDATTQPAADAERELTVDELDALLNSMTPEQLAELMKAAMVLRLEQERAQVAAEIKGGLLYDPKDIAAAVKILKTDAANTQADNIERICKALAKVDPLFGKAYGQMLKKDYKAAAASAAKVVDDQRATYLSAATFYVYAQCLTGDRRGEDAVEVYRQILINMPDRSASPARRRCRRRKSTRRSIASSTPWRCTSTAWRTTP